MFGPFGRQLRDERQVWLGGRAGIADHDYYDHDYYLLPNGEGLVLGDVR